MFPVAQNSVSVHVSGQSSRWREILEQSRPSILRHLQALGSTLEMEFKARWVQDSTYKATDTCVISSRVGCRRDAIAHDMMT